MRTKTDLMTELKLMLHDVFEARSRGESHPRLARAHGYVDGFMRALLETGMATQQELIGLVAAERSEACGPALSERVAPLSADAVM